MIVRTATDQLAKTRVRTEFERQVSADEGGLCKAYCKFLVYVVDGMEWKRGEKEDVLLKAHEACDEAIGTVGTYASADRT